MSNRFLGSQYPIVSSTRGLMAQKSDIDQIKADMLQLLLTNPGERVMLPEFGVPLRKLIFEPNDTILESEAKAMIDKALKRWEPRIVVQQIEITSNFSKNNLNPLDDANEIGAILGIKINFVDPYNIQSIEQLAVELPLQYNRG